MRQVRKTQQGFTLIELIAVIVILGILAATAIPKYIALQRDAQRKAALTAVAETQSRLNLAFSQFLLMGGECARLTGFSFAAYEKPTRSTTSLSLGDGQTEQRVGGWKLEPATLDVADGSTLQLTGFSPPGEDVVTPVTESDPDASSFRVYFPQCPEGD